MFKAPKVVAEIGCNHKGDITIAHQMIKIAANYCNVDVVKFQKRNPRELLTEEEYNAPHPNPENSYGKTYGEHREFLEFDLEAHQLLKQWCEQEGVIYSTSVWDLTSAREIISLQPQIIKIPSACNLKFDLLELICRDFTGEIHLSLGMTTKAEQETIISFFEKKGRNKDLIIYACTSGYPVNFDEVCLYEIHLLQEKYRNRVKGVGFSGHHLGIAVDVAAMTLGAEWIERHFTLDKTWKGTDHKASLEPEEMYRLVRDVGDVFKALRYKKQDILDVEAVQRRKLKRL